MAKLLLITFLLIACIALAIDIGKARAGDDSIVKFMNKLRSKNGK